MFDFERLDVYRKVRELNGVLLPIIFSKQNDYPYIADQFKRATLSVLLNLSEGTGRMSTADKRRFYVMSRSSVFECVSILQTIYDLSLISQTDYDKIYSEYENISKMLLGLIRGLKEQLTPSSS